MVQTWVNLYKHPRPKTSCNMRIHTKKYVVENVVKLCYLYVCPFLYHQPACIYCSSQAAPKQGLLVDGREWSDEERFAFVSPP